MASDAARSVARWSTFMVVRLWVIQSVRSGLYKVGKALQQPGQSPLIMRLSRLKGDLNSAVAQPAIYEQYRRACAVLHYHAFSVRSGYNFGYLPHLVHPSTFTRQIRT